jgi:hypothetical protein
MDSLYPSAADISSFYLQIIAQNTANLSQPHSDPGWDPVDFGSPLPSAVAVNSLWLLSLLISLTCALMAMSVQQWARRHEDVTPQRYSLLEQARMRALFAAGIDSRTFRFIVGTLPTLVHLSMFFFVVGFLIFVLGIHATIFTVACCWVVVFVMGYYYVTMMPLSRPGSPFYTPLSSPVAYAFIYWSHRTTRKGHRNWGMMEFAEEKARDSALELDGDVLKRTLNALSGDQDLERFFDAIPGFCDSEMVEDPQHNLDILGRLRLAEELVGFWDRTLSSNLVSESVKERRRIICVDVIKAAKLTTAIIQTISYRGISRGRASRSIEIGRSLGNLRNSDVASLARGITAGIIANAERSYRWSTLTMEELGLSEDKLRNYLAHGDSVLLANLIHITRHFFDSLCEGDRDLARESLCILPLVSGFNILNTLPKLQYDFCSLWNLIIQQAGNNGAGNKPFIEKILIELRPRYVDLHPTAPAATSTDSFTRNEFSQLPLCEIADHYPNFTSDIYRDGAAASGTTGGPSRAPITTSSTSPIPESSHSDAPVVPHRASSNLPPIATVTSSYSHPPESQSTPIVSPPSRSSRTTQGITQTSLTGEYVVQSPLSIDTPRRYDSLADGTTAWGMQTEQLRNRKPARTT